MTGVQTCALPICFPVTIQGGAGPQGNQGDEGEAGNPGPQGDGGPQGDQGVDGPQGPAGDTGPQGDAGGDGPQGDAGGDGPQGDPGPQGNQGNQGAQGAQGEAGSGTARITFSYLPTQTTNPWSSTSSGSGAGSIGQGGLFLNTGATDGSMIRISMTYIGDNVPALNILNENPELQVVGILSLNTSTNFVASILFNTDNTPDNTGALTAEHFGFILDTTTLYASNSDGATQTTTDISSGVTVTAINCYHIIETSGTNVKFYVNQTLKATHTTNLPAGAASSDIFAVSLDNDTGVTTNRWAEYGDFTVAWDAI